jgi:preprotein translocase subunit YajC
VYLSGSAWPRPGLACIERNFGLNTVFYLLSDAATTPVDKQDPPFWARPDTMIFVLLGVFLLYMFTSSSKQRKQKEKEHDRMLANLKRGDRVQTIGGILGAVVEARENEVVLKIDESTNTKIRVSRDAIKKVTAEEPDVK